MPRPDIMNQEPERHESYGLVGFSRVSGTGRKLFGSSVKHCHTIRLTLHEARKYRDYQKSRYMSDGQLIEVEMSPTQFAECITSMNMGDGVPCTIKRVRGEGKNREECPEISFAEQTRKDLKEEMAELGEVVARLEKHGKEILGKPGAIKKADKEKLLFDLLKVSQEVKSNIPFVHQCFQESVDKTVVEAKQAIDSTLQCFKEQVGEAAIKAGAAVPLLSAAENIEEAIQPDQE